MNKSIIGLMLIILLVFTGCVPINDIIYLQDKGKSNNESLSKVELKPYRLQTNDILNVTIKAIDPKLVEIFSMNTSQSQQIVSSEILYYNGYSVDDHGNIRIPILGEINVLGFTLEEARIKIENQLLQEYLKKESGVFVTVKLAGFRYTINGEVAATGTKTLYQDKVNIMEAIANAGDITVTGDRKDVKIIRQFPQGSETFTIDLTDKNAMNSPCYFLQPNDYIYVKPLKQKTWGTGTTGIQSLQTIITLLSLATTTYLLLKN
jgi:polysaccharide export outer membrane protein